MSALRIALLLSLTIIGVADAQTNRLQVSGAPGTYQIIAVSIPDRFPRAGESSLELVSQAGFTTLGTRRWQLSSLAGKSRVTGTIGIPANAPAGRSTAAEFRFTAVGVPTIVIPVDVDVALERKLTARVLSAPARTRSGRQATFSYELANSGNATESVETRITLPDGWKATQRGGTNLSINPASALALQVAVSIPATVGTGSFFLRVDVLDHGVVRSSVPVTIETLEGASRSAADGPVVALAVAGSSDASGRGGTLTTATIRGPVYDSVRMDARFSIGQASSGPSMQALARLGSYRATPSLVLSSPSGRLALGAAGGSFSELTGLYAYGRGVALDAHSATWRFTGLGAFSNQGWSAGRSQPLFGVRGDIDAGPLQLMSSVSHLRGGELSRNRLDAAGVGATLDAGFSTTIAGEVAMRQFNGGRAPGWSTEIARTVSNSSARVRLTHAPGGSDAFARATDDVVADATQSISRFLLVSGSAWRLSDSTVAFNSLRSSGWALRPELRVHSSTTLAVEARANQFNTVIAGDGLGAAGGYGGTERQLGVSVSTNVRQLYASGSVAGGSVSRTVGGNTGVVSEQATPKIWWNTMAAWRGAMTTVDLQGRMEEERDISGAIRRPSVVSLRGQRVLGSSIGTHASADGEVQQIRGFSPTPTTIMRAGLTMPVNDLLGVKVSAERNPLFTSTPDGSPWIYAMRVEQSSHAPMMREPGTSGFVYRDINSNRKHDAGEPGFEGVTVTRGDESAVTDSRGEYRLTGDARSSIVLDESSLPLGWVRQTSVSPDIAVVSNLSAEVRFNVALPSNGTPSPALGGIRVIARDAAGREWMGRMTSPSIATFDALAPGTYSLEFDLTSLAEPLVVRAPLPLLQVTPLLANYVTVYLDPRPLRMWRASSTKEKP
jgi:hypothetical protein